MVQQLGRGLSGKRGEFGNSTSDEAEVLAQVVYSSVAYAFSGYVTRVLDVILAPAEEIRLGWVVRRLTQ